MEKSYMKFMRFFVWVLWEHKILSVIHWSWPNAVITLRNANQLQEVKWIAMNYPSTTWVTGFSGCETACGILSGTWSPWNSPKTVSSRHWNIPSAFQNVWVITNIYTAKSLSWIVGYIYCLLYISYDCMFVTLYIFIFICIYIYIVYTYWQWDSKYSFSSWTSQPNNMALHHFFGPSRKSRLEQ